MTNDQLTGKYARLRDELAAAYAEPISAPTRSGRIERLAAELLEIETRLAVLQGAASAIQTIETAASDAAAGSSPRLAA